MLGNEPRSELGRYAFGHSDKKPGPVFWLIVLGMMAYIIFSFVTITEVEGAECLSRREARREWPGHHLSWRGRHCWYSPRAERRQAREREEPRAIAPPPPPPAEAFEARREEETERRIEAEGKLVELGMSRLFAKVIEESELRHQRPPEPISAPPPQRRARPVPAMTLGLLIFVGVGLMSYVAWRTLPPSVNRRFR